MLSATLFPVPFSTVPIESNCRSIRHACSRQPNHRRTRQVSVIICVIATEVSYPHPLFYRSISYPHSQPSIRASDPWLLHAGVFASLHAPVSRFFQNHCASMRIGLRCFHSSRCRVPAGISISGKDFPHSFCIDNSQPFLIFFFFLLPSYVFQHFVLSALRAPQSHVDLHCHSFLLLSICVFFRLPQRLRHPGTLKSQLLIGITQKMDRNEKSSMSIR